MACDVESWTEDADVLLELGVAWHTWSPQGVGGKGKRLSGNAHFSELYPLFSQESEYPG